MHSNSFPIRNAWALMLAAGVAAVAGYFLLPGSLLSPAYQAIGAVACASVIVGVALHRPATWRWWLVIAAGVALQVTGDVTYAVLEAAGEPPFPSLADAFYLGGAAGLIIGLAGLAAPEDRGTYRPVLLDAALIAAAGSVLSWRFLIDPQLDAGVDLGAGLIAGAYPAMDMLLVGVVARHVLTPGRKSVPAIVLVAGVGAFLIADVLYTSMSLDGSYVVGMPVDAGWLLGYLCMGVAALHPGMGRLSEGRAVDVVVSNGRLVVVVIALLVSVVALATTPLNDDNDMIGVIVGSFVVVALVVVRLVAALVRSRALLIDAADLRAALTVRATTDALSGLPNRDAFVEALGSALAEASDDIAVFFVDLDNFKQINDTWGHAVGDQVLVEAGRRVRTAVPAHGLVARLGGDELAVMIRTDDRGAEIVAERVLEAFGSPVHLSDTSIAIRPSIGIALGREADASAMLRQADIAMYDAKQAGGARWSIYRDASLGGVVQRYRLTADLELAIERHQLRVEYQPIVDLVTRQLVGVEALVRWDHPEHGSVSPATFIPIAEASGLIGTIDMWVMTEAAMQVAAWDAHGAWSDELRVHVNISPREAADPGFVDSVLDVLRLSGIRTQSLVIEVTESALLDGRGSHATLTALTRLGMGAALDDFGTRYAVLASLASLPFNTLKIDRSFVVALGVESRANLFEGIVRLAASLGMETVAEGVETEAQRQQILAAGCRYGQGYLFARPLRPADVEPLLVAACRPVLALVRTA